MKGVQCILLASRKETCIAKYNVLATSRWFTFETAYICIYIYIFYFSISTQTERRMWKYDGY